MLKIIIFIVSALFAFQIALAQNNNGLEPFINRSYINGDAQLNEYLPLLQGKRVALIANQSSVFKNTHLADTLLALGVKVKKVFSPEHGFRGKADAGEHVKNIKDFKTGLTIISLYGKNYKPKPADLKDVDVFIYDLQDVGARFYTYISTLYYTLQSAAELNKEYIILDRPNPNGFYVDGPVLEDSCKSYVGIIPIPIVHGCTVAELARMMIEEGWLKTLKRPDVKIISVKNYKHDDLIELPVKPSPNLPNIESIVLYPSLCLFEGTGISVGRGTDTPFQIYGHPTFPKTEFSFIPVSTPGASKNPPFQDQKCNGYDVTTSVLDIYQNKKMKLSFIMNAYQNFPNKSTFFNNYFKNLSGTKELKQMIIDGKSESEIRYSWESKLKEYKLKRQKYLLYP
jgi:uncharacterized protein YbbC (DUF1343 family)